MPTGIYKRKPETLKMLTNRILSVREMGQLVTKGVPKTKEIKKKMGDAQRGVKSVHWKGMNAGYHQKHTWIHLNYGKASKCENCGLTKIPKGFKRYFEWANISKEYKREVEDYLQLCIKCHRAWDSGNLSINLLKNK